MGPLLQPTRAQTVLGTGPNHWGNSARQVSQKPHRAESDDDNELREAAVQQSREEKFGGIRVVGA